MKFKFEKQLRIIEDLMTYCHFLGSHDMNVDLKATEGASHFIIRAHIPQVSSQVLDEIRLELNRPRQQEVEQNYWGLTSEAETDFSLMLVGVMVDESQVDYNDGILTIHTIRYD
ncbi:hypothetical protein U6B65_14900 (plasmid) [Oscillospiraceae bacterium MB08-C2-2]|nr:hypothetical protein U6B65_14900 [Oscillospiraceae bacterium MB08-C2-2]